MISLIIGDCLIGFLVRIWHLIILLVDLKLLPGELLSMICQVCFYVAGFQFLKDHCCDPSFLSVWKHLSQKCQKGTLPFIICATKRPQHMRISSWSPWRACHLKFNLTIFDFWKWQPAKPRTGTTILSYKFLSCVFVAIWWTEHFSELSFRTEHECYQRLWLFPPPFVNRLLLQHRSTLLCFNVGVVARSIHSASEFANAVFGKCFWCFSSHCCWSSVVVKLPHRLSASWLFHPSVLVICNCILSSLASSWGTWDWTSGLYR